MTNTAALSNLIADEAMKMIKVKSDKIDGSSMIAISKLGHNEAALSTTNGIVIGETTQSIQKLISEIGGTMESQFSLSKYFPTVTQAVKTINVEIVDPIAGKMQPRVFGQPFANVKKRNVRTYSMSPASFGEKATIGEGDIAFLRSFGDANTAVRGLMQRIALETLNLQVRGDNLIKDIISTSFFTGSYVYLNPTLNNEIAVNYGVPANNTFLPAAVWATGTPGNYVINATAVPMSDIYRMLTAYSPFLPKLSYIRELVMNPITASWLFDNPSTKDFLKYGFNNEKVYRGGNDFKENFDSAMQYFIPELNVSIRVDRSVIMPDDSDGNPLRDNSYYVIPDGYIGVMVDATSHGGPLGEMVMTLAVQNGGYANPQGGRYLLIEDNTVPGSKGGLSNPYIDIVSGGNMGLKGDRPFDWLKMKVKA